ncbi:MAG: hypothetical protein ABI947_11610 [Chloroflexota bacterium]
MNRSRVLSVPLTFLLILSVFATLLIQPNRASAASIVNFTFTSNPAYSVTATGTTDDGGGFDIFTIVCYNPDGSVADVDSAVVAVGATSTSTSTCGNSGEGYTYAGPIARVAIYDTPTGGPGDTTSHTYAYQFPLIWPLGASLTGCAFKDGRVNDCDTGQTGAIYCNQPNKGDIRIYAIYKSKGYLALDILKAEISVVPEKPVKHTLIKKGGGFELWRLVGGQLQLIGPALDATKPGELYVFRFNCG